MIIGTIVKEEEDRKPKLETELDEQEIRRIEALHRSDNKKKSWPTNARLVHIDGTDCSPTCMKDPNSKYHSDTILELEDATPNTSQSHLDPRISRTMISSTDVDTEISHGNINNSIELEVATNGSN